MIRLVLIILFLTVFFLLSIPIYLFELILGVFSMKLRNHSSYFIVRHAFRIILFLSGTKVVTKGFENIPKDTPVLYIANHRSFFDIVISYSMVPPLTGYISKKEVKRVPFLNTWMYFMNCLFLDRNNTREGLKTILAGIEHIKSGISIFIFPEGTRGHSDTQAAEFKEGAMKIAIKTDCPVVPVAFTNTSAIFEDHLPKIKRAKVIIEFGSPIIPSGLQPEDKKFFGKYAHDIIETMLIKNAEELNSENSGGRNK